MTKISEQQQSVATIEKERLWESPARTVPANAQDRMSAQSLHAITVNPGTLWSSAQPKAALGNLPNEVNPKQELNISNLLPELLRVHFYLHVCLFITVFQQ